MAKTTAPTSHATAWEAPVAGGNVDVGGRLRALREARQLSIRALAEASGLAVNTLSLIENGRTSPSVSTLQQIAVALSLPISAFFTPEIPHRRLVFRKADQQQPTTFPHGALADLGAAPYGWHRRRPRHERVANTRLPGHALLDLPDLPGILRDRGDLHVVPQLVGSLRH